MNKEREFYRLLDGMRRNYPNYTSTFGNCCEDGCGESARGCGTCAECYEEKMVELLKDADIAKQVHEATQATHEAVNAALEAL